MWCSKSNFFIEDVCYGSCDASYLLKFFLHGEKGRISCLKFSNKSLNYNNWRRSLSIWLQILLHEMQKRFWWLSIVNCCQKSIQKVFCIGKFTLKRSRWRGLETLPRNLGRCVMWCLIPSIGNPASHPSLNSLKCFQTPPPEHSKVHLPTEENFLKTSLLAVGKWKLPKALL